MAVLLLLIFYWSGLTRQQSIMQRSPKKEEGWIIRFVTNDCKYRIQLSSGSTYQEVLNQIAKKTNTPISQFEVYSQNGRKLNIDPKRRLKDVIYLAHGSILNVAFPNDRKKSASLLHPNLISADSKITFLTEPSPPKAECFHSPQGRCLNCLSHQPSKDLSPKMKMKEEQGLVCTHSPKAKCFNCVDKELKSPKKEKEAKKISPAKPNNPEDVDQPCRHRSTITCKKCVRTPKKVKEMVMIKPSQIKESKESMISVKQEKTQQRKCTHGESGRCLNCLKPVPKKQDIQKQECRHGPEGKCFNCLLPKEKAAYVPFDDYLLLKRSKCSHSKDAECLNCLPIPNLRLTLDKNCKLHAPYPQGLCSACKPENVTIKSQQFRHVDYVQFMNQRQVQSFIDYWLTEKRGKTMRVGFLYGYYAEDPYFKNGIRAIVQALYEPHQHSTEQEFWILDSEERKDNLEIVVSSLGLEKIGIIIASPNDSETPFTEAQIRMLARMQEKQSVTHATGYKLSNFFTVLVRQGKDKSKPIQPEIFMISDQGQALQNAKMLVWNKQHPFKLKVKTEAGPGELLPSVYLAGNIATEFQIQFVLVKIASGMGKSSKFAILKGNLFPCSSRGPVKTEYLKQYIRQTRGMPSLTRLGDFNLLLFVAETIDLQTVMQIGLSVSGQKEIDKSLLLLIDKHFEKLVL